MSQILTISNDLRTIDIPRDFVLGVESDDDVNRVYFSLPAMYGDTALWPYKIRINYMNANGEGDMYTVPDEDKEIEANGVVDSIAIVDAVEEVIEFTDTRYASSYDQDTVHLYYHEPDELDTQSNSIWFDISSDTIYMYRTAYGDQQWHNIEEKYVYDTTTGEWSGYPAVEASRLKTILRLIANNWSGNENSTISYSEDMFLFVAKTESAANSFLAQTGSAPYFLFAEYSKNNTLVTKLYQYVPKADGSSREWIEITDESTFGVPKNESGVPIYGDNYHIRFSWLVGRHACEIKGKVRFIVCLKLTDDQGVITNEFNTAVHEVPVLEGLETSEAIVQEREDIIEAILLRMDKIESIDIEGGYDKVIEVLDSIPEDYSELSQDVSDLKDDFDGISEATYNLFDPSYLLRASGWTEHDGVYSGTNNAIYALYGPGRNSYPFENAFDSAKTYTLAFDGKSVGSGSGNTLQFIMFYTDGSYTATAIETSYTEYVHKTLTSIKPLSHINISYSGGASGSTAYIKNIILSEGDKEKTYIDHKTALDIIARDEISNKADGYAEASLPPTQNAWIRASNGEQVSSSATYMWAFTNVPKRIKAYLASEINVLCAIAFYNTDSISTDSYMEDDSISFQSGAHQDGLWYYAEVPDGCKLVAITTMRPSDTVADYEIYFDLESALSGKIEDINTKVDEFDNKDDTVLFTGSKYIYHYGMSAVANRDIIPVIPSQTIFDVRNAANLGYKYMEVNVIKTSDNKYVTTHGQAGNLGHDFDTLTGEDAYGTPIRTNTLAYLQENFRYRSSEAQYRVSITTLEDFLHEAKLHDITVMVQYVDDTEMNIAKGIMGEKMFMYLAPRAKYAGPILEYYNYTTKEEILARCETVGKPYIYSMGNPSYFADSVLQDIIDTLHLNGYYIASAYIGGANLEKYSRMGFDFFAVGENSVTRQVILDGKLLSFNQDGSVTWTDATVL